MLNQAIARAKQFDLENDPDTQFMENEKAWADWEQKQLKLF
jgi:hypothetical protein